MMIKHGKTSFFKRRNRPLQTNIVYLKIDQKFDKALHHDIQRQMLNF